MTVKARFSTRNYVQLILTSLVSCMILYPFLGVRSFISFFFIWAIFELAVRSDFKKQVPCPHCGFDATWYKKDVKVAKQKVKEFWNTKGQNPSTNIVKS